MDELTDSTFYPATIQTGNAEVMIDDLYIRVVGGEVSELDLARFQNKVTFGPYDKDSDPLISSYVMGPWNGGMGNEVIKEGVDDDTFWDSTLETRYADGASLLPLTTSHGGSSGTAAVAKGMGDFPASGPSYRAAFDTSLETWDEDAEEFVAWTTLTASPVARGVEFEGDLYIPLGGNGFDVVETDGTVGNDDTFEPIHFLVWDRKLMALTTGGALWMKGPGGAAWDYANSVGPTPVTLPSGDRPRKLVNFYTSNGTPALHVVTDTKVYAYDADGETLFETHLDFPKHPNQGRGAVNWRGDTMFVSVGTDIHGYNGTNITAMGPAGRFGLPARLRGSIVDLVGEYNALLAMVEGQPGDQSLDDAETMLITPPLYRDRHTYHISDLPYTPVYSSIVRWSNSQWHKVWESTEVTGTPTWMTVSETGSDYALWWGYGSQMFRQKLPTVPQNPKQMLRSGVQEFMPSGFLISGWFDADMTAFTKLASHMEVNLDNVIGTSESGGSVFVEYQYNESESWRTLGTASTVGKTILPFQTEELDSGNEHSRGLAFRRIRFRFTYTQKAGETLLSPLMSSAVFKFIKVPESQLSWQFRADFTQPYNNQSPEYMARKMRAFLSSQDMAVFRFRDNEYRIRVAQASAQKGSGYDERSQYDINLVEVSLGSTRDPSTVIKYEDRKIGA